MYKYEIFFILFIYFLLCATSFTIGDFAADAYVQ